MQEQKERISYGRLVTRASFYRDKALNLEKKVVFAEEQVQSLQDQVRELNEDHTSSQERQKHFEQLKKDFEQLKERHQQLQDGQESREEEDSLSQQLDEKNQQIETLNQTISELQNGEVTQGGADESERIKQFETLLAEVQTDLNEKEQQLETYQARIRSLEKRLASQNYTPTRQVATQPERGSKAGKRALAFFDYSIILGEQKETIIRGNFHLENVGREALSTPFVCFRFYPIDASSLKGKIISIDQAERNDDSTLQWVYMDDEWGENAKERGEVWVRPYQNGNLNPGEKLTLEDFQIPIKKHFEEKIIVEGFVYFQQSEYKEKAANQILITF